MTEAEAVNNLAERIDAREFPEISDSSLMAILSSVTIVANFATDAALSTGQVLLSSSSSLYEPGIAYHHYNLAISLARYRHQTLESMERAAREFRAALRIDPNYREAAIQLGIHLLDLERFEESLEVLQRAKVLAPDSANVEYHLGLAAGSLGFNDLAVDCFRKATELDANYSAAWLNLGAGLRYAGREREAVEAEKRGKAIDELIAERRLKARRGESK